MIFLKVIEVFLGRQRGGFSLLRHFSIFPISFVIARFMTILALRVWKGEGILDLLFPIYDLRFWGGPVRKWTDAFGVYF